MSQNISTKLMLRKKILSLKQAQKFNLKIDEILRRKNQFLRFLHFLFPSFKNISIFKWTYQQ